MNRAITGTNLVLEKYFFSFRPLQSLPPSHLHLPLIAIASLLSPPIIPNCSLYHPPACFLHGLLNREDSFSIASSVLPSLEAIRYCARLSLFKDNQLIRPASSTDSYPVMRTSILRHAGLCRVALGLGARRVQPAFRVVASAASTSHFIERDRSRYGPSIQLSRFYSAEASAAARGSPDEITKFRDMASLGVHPSLIQSVVGGMGYEDMTQVQSMTIKPGLEGKDLYV